MVPIFPNSWHAAEMRKAKLQEDEKRQETFVRVVDRLQAIEAEIARLTQCVARLGTERYTSRQIATTPSNEDEELIAGGSLFEIIWENLSKKWRSFVRIPNRKQFNQKLLSRSKYNQFGISRGEWSRIPKSVRAALEDAKVLVLFSMLWIVAVAFFVTYACLVISDCYRLPLANRTFDDRDRRFVTAFCLVLLGLVAACGYLGFHKSQDPSANKENALEGDWAQIPFVRMFKSLGGRRYIAPYVPVFGAVYGASIYLLALTAAAGLLAEFLKR